MKDGVRLGMQLDNGSQAFYHAFILLLLLVWILLVWILLLLRGGYSPLMAPFVH